MGALLFEIKGLSNTLKNLEAQGKQVAAIVEDELNAFGLNTVNDAKRLVPVDEGFLRNSITFVKSGLSVEIIVAADYAAYLEFGTRRFAAATVATLPLEWQEFAAQFRGPAGSGTFEEMVQRLVRWVMKKGIGAHFNINTHRQVRVGKQTKAQTAEADAYAIAKYILINGIVAHPFLYPAWFKNKQILLDNLKLQLS